MKRILIILAFLIGSTVAIKAQPITPLYGSITSLGFDTLKDAATMNFTTNTNALNANKSGSYAVGFKSANVSGTSTFKVILQGSIDGSNYFNLIQLPGTNGINCDTLQVNSGVPAYWAFTAKPWLNNSAIKVVKIRLKFVGTGTQVTRISDVYLLNQ